MTRKTLRTIGGLLAVVLALAPMRDSALARSGHPQTPEAAAAGAGTKTPGVPANTDGLATLRLSASLTGVDPQVVRSGLVWRIFEEGAQPDGTHKLVAQFEEATPTVPLPDGAYLVHVAYGLAGATRRVVVEGRHVAERVALNAGALKLVDMLGDTQIPAQRLAISIYVPERGNSEAKLILSNAKSGEVICLPEGAYHIVSTLLDTTQGAQGGNNATNSVVTADLKVPAGKLIEATLKHHAATMTLKLVKAPGGEALANTSFSVLTPGGDVIRELIGAFPSLVLAEGEYVAIARHEGKTYQNTFRVQSTKDADVEVVMKDDRPPEEPAQ
ncbi:hypothetical protein [Methylocystis echinoides]|uniref:Uncharacterized protein n=1 Tax=Methylocystis echinoides TaxID=29468 RepID=A0A9W6GTJ1_9HYPH|nr:hypothetical protein [Methylocystis echinoides]GLI92674.1 hypothetical protein LMG27198_16660 [Methylocystis echinoides]